MQKTRDIEAIYPLSPLQQGLLFHSVSAPEDDPYLRQVNLPVRGELDPALLERAWREVVDRHAALRTAFVWRGIERPLQAVRRGVSLPWQSLDWTDCPEDERDVRIAAFLEADRLRSFDLAKP